MSIKNENRIKAWKALADIFLDTPPEIDWIASELKETGYSEDELYSIYADEVAPNLYPNLNCVAGVWGVWDDEVFEDFKSFQKKWYHSIPFVWKFLRWNATSNSISTWHEVITKFRTL